MRQTRHILLLCGLLGACTPRPQPVLLACPMVGIDTNAPNFYLQISPQQIEAFYNCQIYNLQQQAQAGYSSEKMKFSTLQIGMQYQQNLWRRALNQEITPGAAQQMWLEFANTQNFQNAQLEQSTRAADAAEDSADAQNYQNYQRDDSRHSDSTSRATSSAPTASTPDPASMMKQMLGN